MYIQEMGANPIGKPNMPTLVTMALPKGECLRPSAARLLSASPAMNAESLRARRSTVFGKSCMARFVLARSGSRPSFMLVARSVSSAASRRS